MKNALPLLFSTLCVLASTQLGWSESKVTKELPGSTVLALVDQQPITMNDLNQQMNRPDIKAAADALKDQPAEVEKLRKSVFASIIDRDLLIKAAKSAPTYNADGVKKEVNSIIEEQGGESVLQPILKSYGTSWDDFIKDMNERITIEQYIQKDLLAKVAISDDELRSEFTAKASEYVEPETVTARHILVLVPPKASEQDKQKALERIKEIRARVVAPGADFGKIASETSDDTASKVDGGNLGAFQRGMMVPEFEKAAFELKVGEISEPIKTDYGYHIIKVEQHQQSQQPTFETAKDKVRYQVMSKIHDKVISEKLAELRASTKIEYKVPEFKQS